MRRHKQITKQADKQHNGNIHRMMRTDNMSPLEQVLSVSQDVSSTTGRAGDRAHCRKQHAGSNGWLKMFWKRQVAQQGSRLVAD